MTGRTEVSIHMPTSRSRLAPRREPYWRNLVTGGHLGYRKTTKGGESWIARYRDKEGQRHFKALGQLSDLPYKAAKVLAEDWFNSCRMGVVRSCTVESACGAYVDNLKKTKRDAAAKGAESRFKHRVYNHRIRTKKLDELLETDIDAWRDEWAATKAAATVNRDINDLIAALNFAHKKHLVTSNTEWRKIEKLHVENPARTEYITKEERRALVCVADPVVKPFLLALIYTAARPGEIANAKVSDFNATTQKLNLSSRKGKGSKLRNRTIPIVGDALKLFVEQAKDKKATDYIFLNNGRKWINYDWGDWMKPAFVAAGLADDVCTYTIRHSSMADWLQNGVDVATVAKIAGTSIAMIQDHYAKYIPEQTADDLKRINLLY